ncbi:MAG: hypothetical protein M1832_003962 [Thelocarpon impressellum]|nr:MAG: hypothetical protein M1832_003962 [Thelocarpon impressellum]
MSSDTSSPMAAPTFDPFSQSFTLQLQDGTPFNVSIPDLDTFISYSVRVSINYGAQTGASLLLLVVLLLLTKSDKRSSPIFLLNALSLTLNFIRSLLQCLYFVSGFCETYAYFGNDFSRVPRSDYANSIAANVLTLLLLVCVELSLMLQTRVVCKTVRREVRYAVTVVSSLAAFLAVGFRLGLVIENSMSIMKAESFYSWAWLASATNITATISISLFCGVFATKLGFALYERKQLGMKQFAPMRIIFIMGCQTMIVPAIFSILQYAVPTPEFSTAVLTLVAIFLPLSSLWAAAALDGTLPPTTLPKSGQRKLMGSYASGSTAVCTERKGSEAMLSQAGKSPDSPVGSGGATRQNSRPGEEKEDYDIEAQDVVRVHRSFTVESRAP